MPNMVEVVIDSIRVSLMSQQRVVILREMNSDRYLPIMVGIYEAEHLTLALQDVEVSRPLTYDLFVNILDTLNAEVTHIEVVSLKDETYFGNIVLSINGTLHNIDSRPSDAMNLAIRMQVPIFVADEVLEEAGRTGRRSQPVLQYAHSFSALRKDPVLGSVGAQFTAKQSSVFEDCAQNRA